MKNFRFLHFWLLNAILLLSINAAYSQDALIIHKADGSSKGNYALDKIQRITFSDDDLSVKPFDGDVAVYAFDDVAKLTFGDIEIVDVVNPPATALDVVVYVTREGEIVIESPVAVQSVTLFNIDGKVLRVTTETTINASSLTTGVYILQIKTVQGVVAKKIIKK
jgi:hypothetical protein